MRYPKPLRPRRHRHLQPLQKQLPPSKLLVRGIMVQQPIRLIRENTLEILLNGFIIAPATPQGDVVHQAHKMDLVDFQPESSVLRGDLAFFGTGCAASFGVVEDEFQSFRQFWLGFDGAGGVDS